MNAIAKAGASVATIPTRADPGHASVYEALSAVQVELIGAIRKDGTNNQHQSTYPTLDGVLMATIPVLNKHGLMLMQPVSTCLETSTIRIDTTILHIATGQQLVYPLELPIPAGASIEFIGGMITYMRRYSLMPLVALCSVDEDAAFGQVAVGRQAPAQQAGMPGNGGRNGSRSPGSASQVPIADRIREKLKTSDKEAVGEARNFINGRTDLTDAEKTDLLKMCKVREDELTAQAAQQGGDSSGTS